MEREEVERERVLPRTEPRRTHDQRKRSQQFQGFLWDVLAGGVFFSIKDIIHVAG